MIVAGCLVFTAAGDVKTTLAATVLVAEPPDGANQPMGEAQGIFAGRVTWAYDRAATVSLCLNAPGDRYFRSDNYDQSIVDSMVRKSILNLTGASTIHDADSIFTRHNIRKQMGSHTAGGPSSKSIRTAAGLYAGTAYEALDARKVTGRMLMQGHVASPAVWPFYVMVNEFMLHNKIF
jgi:hypothetical protein